MCVFVYVCVFCDDVCPCLIKSVNYFVLYLHNLCAHLIVEGVHNEAHVNVILRYA